MNIVIAGGTGFLGRALTDALTRDGHDIVILTRQPSADRAAAPRVRAVAWTPDGQSGAVGRRHRHRRCRDQSRR